MIRFLRVPSLLIWLTLLWVALWGDLTAGNLAGGLLVAVVVVAVARPTGVTGLERTYFRPISAMVYACYFLVQMVKSNLIVAWEIITPGLSFNRAIIEVPLHTSSPGVVALVANSVTLTPGTVTIEVIEVPTDEGLTERTLFIHVLHYLDMESVRRDVLRLERLAIKAFGSRDEMPRVEAELAAIASSIEKDVGS